MNRIKHLRAQHSVSYDMIKELHNPETAEEINQQKIIDAFLSKGLLFMLSQH